MGKPTVAIIGKPNVGKSTFFNYIVGSRISIVEDTPGVTRDRVYAETNWRGREFTVIDTAGIEPESEDIIISQMREQAKIAIEIADVIIFLTDVKQGVTAADQEIALMLKKSKKPVVLVCNKADNMSRDKNEIYEFYNLGIGEPYPISAANALGIGDVLDAIFEKLPEKKAGEDEDDRIRVAVIGKPNVGKSSLINKILGQNRTIVSSIAGTTRDAIDTEYQNQYGKYVLIDTAGIREAKDEVEKIGITKSKEIAKDADLIIAIFDSSKDLTDEDKEILDIIKNKTAIVVLNKMDLLNKIDENMAEIKNVSKYIVKMSTLEQKGIDDLYKSIGNLFSMEEISLDNTIVITNIRHKNLISKALNSCREAKKSMELGMPLDIIAIFLKEILENLGEITGETVTDDIIDEIFSKFCLGK